MNAPFTLTQPSAASSLLTRQDMSDVENVKDARSGLDAAGNDMARLAAWGARYGSALCARCEDLVDLSPGDLPEDGEIEVVEADLAEIRLGVEGAVKALDTFAEMLPEAHADKLGDITSALENLL